MRTFRRTSLLVVVLALAACGAANWRPVPDPAPRQFPARDVLEFPWAGENVRLHGVRVEGDSLTGVWYLQPPECDSCRVSYPARVLRTARVGRPERVGFVIPIVVVLGVGLLYLVTTPF